MPVYFVQITDTHIGETPDFLLDGFNTYDCAKRAVDEINQLPIRPDFIIHTGDVAGLEPTEPCYALARDLFSQLEAPVYYVAGNHDDQAMIRQFLPMGQKTDLLGEEKLSYTFEVEGERFLVIDAVAPRAMASRGLFSDEQLEIVRREATLDGPRLTVFIHFPPFSLNSKWMDNNMLLVNGTAFHQALLPARDRLRGVFHGHLHQPLQMMSDGITYICARSTFGQFAAWPQDEMINKQPHEMPGFAFAHLLPSHTIVHHHTFVRP